MRRGDAGRSATKSRNALLISRIVALFYALAIHTLAFWVALFVSALLGSKSPSLAFVLLPAFLCAYFAAGWICQHRLHNNRLGIVAIASILSFTLLPFLIYLNRYETESIDPANWLGMLWGLPCMAFSIAGMYYERYHALRKTVTAESVHKT